MTLTYVAEIKIPTNLQFPILGSKVTPTYFEAFQAKRYDSFSQKLEDLLRDRKIAHYKQPILDELVAEKQSHGQLLLIEEHSFSQSRIDILESFLPRFSYLARLENLQELENQSPHFYIYRRILSADFDPQESTWDGKQLNWKLNVSSDQSAVALVYEEKLSSAAIHAKAYSLLILHP
jgi:hypothetical protein